MQALFLSWMMILGAPGDANTNWASEMFETTSHDFGVVMKGSKTEFDFVFTNKYNEDVQIESVTTSCQCTMPEFTRGPIKTWDKGKVHITVNTKSFVGNKNATITVRFLKPYRMEIQLHSYVNIRSDVAVNPGVVYFGTVSQGKKPAIPVNISCVGRRGWQITDVMSTCPFLSVQLQETSRTGNQVSYLMTVYLKDNAPAGRFSEFLELVTNDQDPRNRRFPIQVEGQVRQSLAVNPSPLSFGLVGSGETVTKAVVVEGQEPFQITDIRSEDSHISATIHQMTPSRYTVNLSYRGDAPRTINGSVAFITSMDGSTPTRLDFMGRIMEPDPPAVSPAVEPALAPAEPEEELPEEEFPVEEFPMENFLEDGTGDAADTEKVPAEEKASEEDAFSELTEEKEKLPEMKAPVANKTPSGETPRRMTPPLRTAPLPKEVDNFEDVIPLETLADVEEAPQPEKPVAPVKPAPAVKTPEAPVKPAPAEKTPEAAVKPVPAEETLDLEAPFLDMTEMDPAGPSLPALPVKKTKTAETEKVDTAAAKKNTTESVEQEAPKAAKPDTPVKMDAPVKDGISVKDDAATNNMKSENVPDSAKESSAPQKGRVLLKPLSAALR